MEQHGAFAIRLRVYAGETIALGPGKAALLGKIAETGSISEAARELGMSYRRAWSLVQTMNRSFDEVLVIGESGGAKGGGAHLTPLGEKVLALYRAAEDAAHAAAAAHLTGIVEHLRPDAAPSANPDEQD